MVAKNTLMRKASENTKFASISECSKGMNAWLFVDENVAPAFKKVRSLAKDWKKEGVEIVFTGAVLDEKFLAPDELKPLESLPTKTDLIQKIAVGLKQVPTKVARGTKQIPSKIAYGVRAIAEGDSDIINA
jgi:large subunit ribosomal protein L10